MAALRVQDVWETLDAWAPFASAESWDRVGLQVGDPQAEVTRVVVTLELTEGVRAHLGKGTLVVTHHPLLFRPLEEVRLDTPVGRWVRALLESQTCLVACHTNWDKAPGGTEDCLAQALELADPRPLRPEASALYQLFVHVPVPYADAVRQALAQAGAGRLGAYEEASFGVEGEGTFRPLPGAHPAVGRVGELERTREVRLEMVVPGQRLSAVVEALRRAHPYEMPSFGAVRLEGANQEGGLGRVGVLPHPMEPEELARWAAERLPAPWVRLGGKGPRPVQRVATVGGSGRSLLREAHRAGAQALLTADLGHHDSRLAEDLGMWLLDAGHRETEEPGVKALAQRLAKAFFGVPVAFLPTAPSWRLGEAG
jgi:dinuclear metal center YbgI/SA1388 family protein